MLDLTKQNQGDKDISTHERERRRYPAQVTSIYDADSMDLWIITGFDSAVLKKVRLEDINAWEVRGVEREMGLEARDYAREQLLDKWIEIEADWPAKKGKYGRTLVTIFDQEGRNFNHLLVELGHAKFQQYDVKD